MITKDDIYEYVVLDDEPLGYEGELNIQKFVKTSKIADEHNLMIIKACKTLNDRKRANLLQTYIAQQEKTLRGEK